MLDDQDKSFYPTLEPMEKNLGSSVWINNGPYLHRDT